MDWGGLFVLSIVVAVGSLFTYFTNKARVSMLVGLARELGLHYVAGRWYENGRLIGEHRGVPVMVEYYQRSAGKSSIPYTRVIARGIDPEIHLSSEHIGTKLLQTFTGADFRTGDAGFDDVVDVRGPVHALVGLLDAHTRAAVSAFIFAGHRVEGGAAIAELRGHLFDRAAIAPVLEETSRIAERLQPGFLSPDALSRIAIEDVEPGVRRKALALLRSGDEALARSAHEAARDDWDPGVRIDALFYLRDYAAIERQPSGDVAAWTLLEPEYALRVVRRLTTEASLTGLLGYSHLHELACARLAAVGGAGAVESLRTYADGIFGTGRPAREAIAAIHTRLGHTPGSLSISSADGGELSEASEAGGLSEKKKK